MEVRDAGCDWKLLGTQHQGTLWVNRTDTGALIQHWAEMPYRNMHMMGAGASVYKDSAHAASLQTP